MDTLESILVSEKLITLVFVGVYIGKKIDTLVYISVQKKDTLVYISVQKMDTLVHISVQKMHTLVYISVQKKDTLVYIRMCLHLKCTVSLSRSLSLWLHLRAT